MSDWEDFCDSNGWANDEHAVDHLLADLSPTRRVHSIDQERYITELEIAYGNGAPGHSKLRTDNHVFESFKDAGSAAIELAEKLGGTVQILTGSIGLESRKLFILYEEAMVEAIRLVNEREYWFFPEHPLIKPRARDLLYHQNGGDWQYLARPSRQGCNMTRTLSVEAILGLKFSDSVHRETVSLYGETSSIAQRDAILSAAEQKAKVLNTDVYVIRLDSCNEVYEANSPVYVTATREEIAETEHLL